MELLLAKEVELSKLQQKIKSQVEEKMSKQQRTYFLHEQLKSYILPKNVYQTEVKSSIEIPKVPLNEKNYAKCQQP